MKILYAADERRAAEVAARALHAIAQNVTVTWAHTLPSAVQWVDSNPDAAAVIVEAEVQGYGCAGFIERVRGLGVSAAVVVVARMEPAVLPAAMEAGADAYVVDGPSLEKDLPRVVMAAIRRGSTRREIFTRAFAETEASREAAAQRAARAEEARQQAEARTASEAVAAAARLTELERRYRAAVSRESRICTTLQGRLVELEAALRHADERRATEAVALADQLAARHAEFTARLTQAAQSRDTLAAKLGAVTGALDEALQARKADATAAAAQLARREAELTSALTEAAAARNALETSLAEAEAALRDAQQRAAAEQAGAAVRQAALEDLLAQETDARRTLEQQLASVEAARHEAEVRHSAESTAAQIRMADVQARHDAILAEHAATRTAFEQRLSDTVAALDRERQERAAEAAAAADRLAQREAEMNATLSDANHTRTVLADVQARYDAALAEHADTRAAFEQQLSDTAAALERERQERAADAAAAVVHLAQREAELSAAVADANAGRAASEHAFAEARRAHEDDVQRFVADLAAAAERESRLVDQVASESSSRAAIESSLDVLREKSTRSRRRSVDIVVAHRRRRREHAARLESTIAGERIEFEGTIHAKDEEIRQLQVDRDDLQRTLDEERHVFEQARLASESELQRISAEYDQLRQSLDHLQTALHTLERIADEHAVERARLESVVAERDSALNVQAAEHLAARQAAQDAVAAIQDELRQTYERSRAESARLQRELDSLRRERDASRANAKALRDKADLVPSLQERLEASHKERRREFERAPHGLCHCTREGTIVRANHWLVRLLGYRRAEDLRNVDVGATVFECADDWRWLIDRALSTRKAETIDAVWKAVHGRHLMVRLQALAITDDLLEIVVEDVTNVRALEDRLRAAQRMEAVGRLASEVAVTCDATLRDATREASEWLAALEPDTPQRRQGEQLLSELRRAASFLRHLGVYGEQQMKTVEPVSVRRILGDLAPVLQRVVGDDIELVYPKTSGSFDVDVEAERVERVLVNVAGYARERMSNGGQVRIDLATTIVGRRFMATYPGVRPGPHVLITVAEVSRAVPAVRRRDSDKPGVDLGGLADLVASCGGHLWIEAERAGDMLLKIHLPARVPEDRGEKGTPTVRSERARRLARWLRDRSGVLTRS